MAHRTDCRLFRLQLEGPRALLTGNDWYPPVIGAWDEPVPAPTPTTLVDAQERRKHVKSTSVASSTTTLAGSEPEREREPDDDGYAPTSDLDKLSPSAARDIRELVSQLRTVNTRLSNLERHTANPSVADHTSGLQTPENGGIKPTFNHPPPAPFGVSKITDNALTASNNAQPLGWLARIAETLNFRSFLGGLGAGIFSTTTAATLAALVVFYIRKKKL